MNFRISIPSSSPAAAASLNQYAVISGMLKLNQTPFSTKEFLVSLHKGS